MNDFSGVAFPVHDPSNQIEVELELLRGFVIMRGPGDEWLGSWPVAQLRAAHVGGARFRVTVRQAKLFFDVEDADHFLDALSDAGEETQAPSSWAKFTRRKSSSSTHEPRKDESGPISALEDQPHAVDSRSASPSHERPVRSGEDRVPAHGLVPQVAEYQQDVVEWFEAGMTSWFEFYFRLGTHQGRERFEQASAGLEKAAMQLRSVSEELEELEIEDEVAHLTLTYARGIGAWASALEHVAVGCRMDQPAWAIDGFTKMNEGTVIVEQMLAALPRQPTPKLVTNALSYLDALVPESRITHRSVLLAKEPWRRALLAAGWAHQRRSVRVLVWSGLVNLRGRAASLFSR